MTGSSGARMDREEKIRVQRDRQTGNRVMFMSAQRDSFREGIRHGRIFTWLKIVEQRRPVKTFLVR
jgi:hypothetical protein